MPLACPVTCPCRRSGEGAACLAGAVYAALAAPVFLGGNLAALIGAAVNPPHVVTLPLLLWAFAVAGGLVLLGIGVRALLLDGDGPPALSSLLVAVVAAIALGGEWYPRTMGACWFYGMRGFYIALIAGGVVNLGFALCARLWLAGFVAAEQLGRVDLSAPERERQQLEIMTQLVAERDRLAQEVERLSSLPRGNDLAEFVRIVGGKRMVLAPLHPDREKDEAKKPTAEAKFKQVGALLDRVGVR